MTEKKMSTLRQRNERKNDLKELKQKENDTTDVNEVEIEKKASDFGSILLLLLLYTLQGIPMGLSASIPFLLQEKVGYGDQATFSLVSWPFSLKLLWAPFVDSIYSQSFGRRKSWLIPIQFCCAFLMISGSYFVGDLLGEKENQKPHVNYLTCFFFLLYFMMATQDIAVDGWALTMLSSKNVGHASTCNSVGQTLGYFISYVGFLALHDPSTCNSYFRQIPNEKEGLVSLPGFMHFWGWIMLFTTLGVWFFKEEKQNSLEEKLSIQETYQQMLSVLKLPSIQSLTILLLTSKIAFAATDAIASLKLVEYGLKKEKLALLSPILIPLGIVIPIFLGHHIQKEKPLEQFIWGYPFRLGVGLIYAIIIYLTPSVLLTQDEGIHYYYYLFLLFGGALHELAANMMYVPMMAFYARISDPSIGGTYMTFLNTITNLGSKWPNSVALALVDHLTIRECLHHQVNVLSIGSHTCSNAEEKKACQEAGGQCLILQDGFFIQTAICTIIGLVWLVFFYSRLNILQNLKIQAWRVNNNTK